MADASSLLSEAERALSLGDLETAVRLCGILLESESPPAGAFMLMGLIHNRRDRPDAALPFLEEANALNPNSGQVLLWLSRTLRKLGRSSEALQSAVQANRLKASDPSVLHQLGSCQMDCEQFTSAAQSFREAIALDGSVAVLHYRLGLALSSAGDPMGAASALRECLRIQPGSETVQSALRAIEEALRQGESSESLAAIDLALASGDLSGAESLCASALQTRPADPRLTMAMGSILLRRGSYEAAAKWLEKARETDPSSGDVPIQLAFALQQIGKLKEALIAAHAGVRNAPFNAESHVQLGCVYLDLCNYAHAIHAFRVALELAPLHVFAHRALAQALHRSGNLKEQADVLARALHLDPDSTAIKTSLIESLCATGQVEPAVEKATAFVAEKPNSIEARCALADVHLSVHRTDLADAQIAEALRIESANAQEAFRLGRLLRAVGRIDEAKQLIYKSIQLEPVQGSAYALLSYLKKAGEFDLPRIEAMKHLSSNLRVSVGERADLHYGLGRCHEDLEDYELAMTYFDEANRLTYLDRFGTAEFDRTKLIEFTNRSIAILQSEMERSQDDLTLDANLPVLVFGMMRSGTTLVDQILSSHGLVGSVGEDRFWVEHSQRFLPVVASPIDREQLREVAREYLSSLARAAPGMKRVVDKTPANYAFAPLVHLALPNAKFIHVIRHPADTCLSIYTTMNRVRTDWAHHKEHVAFAYSEYRKMMDCWRKLLPAEAMLEVGYEDLVANPERVTREMVSFCGLSWDDACLRPESNKRSVFTPSAGQVRQPVYTSSTGRWKHYEPWISDFLRLGTN